MIRPLVGKMEIYIDNISIVLLRQDLKLNIAYSGFVCLRMLQGRYIFLLRTKKFKKIFTKLKSIFHKKKSLYFT